MCRQLPRPFLWVEIFSYWVNARSCPESMILNNNKGQQRAFYANGSIRTVSCWANEEWWLTRTEARGGKLE